ncbi:MAG TPA: phenylalanine--tRNA ligase subunit beta [Candidatus Limnocylindria bacterium]|nr:phenylalanine--tRNA ligase subunit beta [Candidatus Limnocylindria bacterium]
MRVPLSWLREYVDFDLPVERLAERLTLLGMEVGSIETIGADWSNVVVGELLEVVAHPNADRLNLTKVRVSGSDAPLSIVCGAHNIVAGQLVPVALPGAVLPGDKKIGVTTIQGTESQGMLCSGAELGLTTDADGIMILAQPTDTAGAAKLPLGKALADVVGDVVIDVDVKPNRGDALSMIGLAREVAAITGGKVRWPSITVPESGDATTDHVQVQVDDEKLCPRFVGRWIDGLKIGPSPLRIQLRLGAAGMRPVSNAVDASNYVMLELGKPIHVFDSTAVSGGKIIVRPAKAGERIETLDHLSRELTKETLVIADERGPIGIAGVMGGAGSEVSDSTTSAIVESAVFDPVSVRRTAFRYGLRSEASLRFEKGQESRLARVGADRTAQLLAEWAGARVATGVVDTHPADEEPRRVAFRPLKVSKLLGGDISPADMKSALARVEVATEKGADADSLIAVVPTHRRDIEIEEDVAEEVIRVIGYETLTPELPNTVITAYRDEPTLVTNRLRDALAGRGLVEVLTNALIGPDDHARLGYAADDRQTIRLENPISIDHSQMRRTMLPGLLGVLRRNERQRRDDMAIFEMGNVHEWRDGAPMQSSVIAVMLAGAARPTSWVEPQRGAGFEDAKGLVELIVARLNAGRVEFAATAPRPGIDHPGRTAAVHVVKGDVRTMAGLCLEVDPRLLAAYDIRAEHVGFALLNLDVLIPLADGRPQVRTIEQLPVVERDLAVVVKRDAAAAKVESAIRSAAGPRMVGVILFDRYTGAPLADGEVSLAYRLRFQPTSDQGSEAHIDAAMANVTRALETEVEGRIRG